MRAITYLTVEQIILMNTFLINKISPDEFTGIREPSALHMTIETPRQEVFGTDIYPTLEEKAAILFINLIKKHCFHNANKRTAYMALHAFLKLNDSELSITMDEALDWCVEIATWPNSRFEELKKSVTAVIKEHIK